MKMQPLYLRQIGKDKRTRIKVLFEGSFAKALLVTYHVQENAGMPFTWEIQEANWNLAVEKEKKEFELFVAVCQKEDNRNFRIAIAEAIKYCKRIARQKKLEKEIIGTRVNKSNHVKIDAASHETKGPRFIDYTPLISKAEIMTKILTIKEDRS